MHCWFFALLASIRSASRESKSSQVLSAGGVIMKDARVGANIISVSDMMNVSLRVIRDSLNVEGLSKVSIMPYSAKTSFRAYLPLCESSYLNLRFHEKETYQMNPVTYKEVVIKMKKSFKGADIIMVLPEVSNLNIINIFRQTSSLPIATYQVSGDYMHVKDSCSQSGRSRKADVIHGFTFVFWCQHHLHLFCSPGGCCAQWREVRKSDIITKDENLYLLCLQAISKARVGANTINVSDMMDESIRVIRDSLNVGALDSLSIMSYTAKTSSRAYLPLCEGLYLNLRFHEMETYQLNPKKYREVVIKMKNTYKGADIIMVIPEVSILNIINIFFIRLLPCQFLSGFCLSGDYMHVKVVGVLKMMDLEK